MKTMRDSWVFLLVALTVAAGMAHADKKADAFADGKDQKSKNPAIKDGVTTANPSEVPGYNAGTSTSLQGLYGSNTEAGGADKAAACGNYAPGADAYANQECGTINYVRGNPSARPKYTIDKQYDPLVVNGKTIANAPQNHVEPMSGVKGSYTSCTDVTTQTPSLKEFERCSVGREVREGQCNPTLEVTYTWETYNGQPTADLTYGYCKPPLVRGDVLALAYSTTYTVTLEQCDDYKKGKGYPAMVWWKVDCYGNKSLFWVDSSSCEVKNAPGDVMPTMDWKECANAPRTWDNCFTSSGNYTSKVTAPIFFDTVNRSSCAELDGNPSKIE